MGGDVWGIIGIPSASRDVYCGKMFRGINDFEDAKRREEDV